MTVMTEPTALELEQEREERAYRAQQSAGKLFEGLRQQEQAGIRESTAEWKTLVAGVADGKVMKLADVQAVLGRQGRTVEELEAAVNLLHQRRGWAADLAKAKTAEATIQRCQRELKEHESRYAEFMREYEATVGPLIRERDNAASDMSASFNAKSELIRSCTDPEALAITAALNARMDELRQVIPATQSAFNQKRVAMQSWIDDGDPGYRPDIERVQGELTEMQAELDAMRAECEQINADYIDAERKYLCDPLAI